MMVEAAGATEAILVRIEAMIAASTTYDELRAMLLEGFPRRAGG